VDSIVFCPVDVAKPTMHLTERLISVDVVKPTTHPNRTAHIH
jgi:hypothetical protein